MSDYNNGTLPDPCLRLNYGFGEQWASVELGDGTGYVRLADYESVQAENAKLRYKVHVLENGNKWLQILNDSLKAENAKLRELARDMWRFTGTACKKYPRLFDPSAQGGQMVQLNMIDAFEQRMDELGVEI